MPHHKQTSAGHDSIRAFAPAKLNLMLRVLGRHADGYHKLQTLFEIIDWGDDLHFIPQPETTAGQLVPVVVAGNFGDLPQSDNLIWQAAAKLRPHARRPIPVRIQVSKRVPAGGGLGGGSSNAATTLRILNQLWDCRLNHQQVAEIGLALGADVPVFLLGHPALAGGVGEQLTPVALPERCFVLVLPDDGISTTTVFADSRLPRASSPLPLEAALQPANWRNDCQVVAQTLCASLAASWQAVEAMLVSGDFPGAEGPHLSGTGSTFFVAFSDEDSARRFSRVLEQRRQQTPSALPVRIRLVRSLRVIGA